MTRWQGGASQKGFELADSIPVLRLPLMELPAGVEFAALTWNRGILFDGAGAALLLPRDSWAVTARRTDR